ncbi:MAG TPA: diaminopimelate epimerase [Flavobacterium sp.]|jgi:diaminopimelate epimerase
MEINFFKYHGTGNDFVMIDNRRNVFPKNDTRLVAFLCDRRFGIGGDGLILLEDDKNADLQMIYYNSDGNLSSMCGNGGRCLVAFAKKLEIISDKVSFMATDGMHYAEINESGTVSLQMKDVDDVKINSDYVFMDTGSPHHVVLSGNIGKIDIKSEGAAIRYSDLYGNAGSNVNFVEPLDNNHFRVRTYERGVEDETLSCGTGVTAVALAMDALGKSNSDTIQLDVEGGKLEVSFKKNNQHYTDIFLKGPATFVFEGTIVINPSTLDN